jgi:hypothetical protein
LNHHDQRSLRHSDDCQRSFQHDKGIGSNSSNITSTVLSSVKISNHDKKEYPTRRFSVRPNF